MSDNTSVQRQLTTLQESQSSIDTQLAELRTKFGQLYQQQEQYKNKRKALENLLEVYPENEVPKAPSEHKRKKYAKISDSTREEIVRNVLYRGTMKWEEAEKVFEVSHASIGRILNEEKARLEGHPPKPAPKRRGRKSPLTIDMKMWMLDEIEHDSQLTLKSLLVKVEQKFNIHTNESSISKTLDEMDITWKNVLTIPMSWNNIETITARAAFISKLGQYIGRPIIYLDESGFNLHTKKSKGRALAGQPAILTVAPKGKRINIIGALSEQGIVHYDILTSISSKKRGTNAVDFKIFLIDLIQKLERNSVILMDNCKIHHSEELESIWKTMKDTYGIDYLFLPRYSPFLNPIEYAWNVIKAYVRQERITNAGELMDAIHRGVKMITPLEAKGFFQQSLKYYPQCLMNVPFTGKPLQPNFTQTTITNSQSSSRLALPPV